MLLDNQKLTELLSNLLGYEVRFCREFMADFNPLKALKRADVQGVKGNAQKEALAVKLLSREDIQTYIAHLKAQMEIETGVTPDKILKELSIIAFQNITDVLQNDENGNINIRRLNDMAQTGQIKKVKINILKSDGLDIGQLVELEFHDKLKGLELLGKHEKMFMDRVDVTTNTKDLQQQAPINIVINHRRPGEPLTAN